MQEDPDSFEFSDPEVEGPLLPNTVCRETADVYIQRKINRHERIIRYYKGRRNALTITCRIPPEILSSIFVEVTRYTEGSFRYHWRQLSWIKAVSHVCSHWRHVALAAPDLWSNIPIDNPSWAIEMVHRSKTAPLFINHQQTCDVLHRSYSTLTEVLRSQLPRIQSLTLDLLYYSASPTINENIINELLPLLCQPAPMMEKLTLRFPQASDHTEPPDKIVLMTPRLRHLKLEGYGMSWSSECMDFRNLRSLEMSLTEKMRPSMAQLLAILRQTSRLENLKVIYLNQKTGQHGLESLPLSRDVDSINLGHLQQIDLSDDLAKCAILLSHIIFSKNAHTITLCIQDHQSPPILPAQTLATKIDDGIMGSIVKLQLGSEIRCWKSTDTRQMPSHDAPFTIEISTFLTSVSMAGARNSFCRSLRLHHLLSLVVMGTTLELDTWLMFGDLPCLEDVRVHSNYTNDISLLKVFHRGLANTPGVLPVRPAFAALRRLTIAEWYLDEIETDSELGTGSAMRLLISCFELRKSNQLPLDSLRLEDCGVNGNDVDRLREIIKDVYWDGSGDIDNVEDEGTDCGSYETDEDMWSLHYRGN